MLGTWYILVGEEFVTDLHINEVIGKDNTFLRLYVLIRVLKLKVQRICVNVCGKLNG